MKKSLASGIYVNPERWNSTKQFKTTRALEERQQKMNLDIMRDELLAVYEASIKAGKILTVEQIIHLYHNPDEVSTIPSFTLLQLFEVHNEKFWARVAIGKRSEESFKKHKTVQDHIKLFLKLKFKENDIEINWLNLDFI